MRFAQASGGYDSDGPGQSSNSSFRGPRAGDAGRPVSFSRPPATDGSEEAELVDALCTPGGLRAAPEREDLRLFVESIAAVNGTTVADLLRQKMVSFLLLDHALLYAACRHEGFVQRNARHLPGNWDASKLYRGSSANSSFSLVERAAPAAVGGHLVTLISARALWQDGGSWQAALRALYALEAVVQQGSSASCGEVAVYFQVSGTYGLFTVPNAVWAMLRHSTLCTATYDIGFGSSSLVSVC